MMGRWTSARDRYDATRAFVRTWLYRIATNACLVASRGNPDVSAWTNSRLLEGDLADAVRAERRDMVISGSLAVVAALREQDLVDEYRLLTFPVVLGQGRRLFPAGSEPAEVECLSAERVGAAVLTFHGRAA